MGKAILGAGGQRMPISENGTIAIELPVLLAPDTCECCGRGEEHVYTSYAISTARELGFLLGLMVELETMNAVRDQFAIGMSNGREAIVLSQGQANKVVK